MNLSQSSKFRNYVTRKLEVKQVESLEGLETKE